MRSGRERRVLATLALLAMALSSCGTRLSGDEREAARGRGPQLSADSATSTGNDDVGDDQQTVSPGMPGDTGATGAADAPANRALGDTRADGGGVSGRTGAPAASQGARAAAGEAIVLGTVGTFSGPSGAAWKPMADMLQVWARDVNGRGGVDGHPIKLVVVDDGADPARHLSAVRDLVENEKAFAFIGNATSNTDSQALRDYHAQQRVPVVGGSITTKTWDEHPMIFPQGTAFKSAIRSHVAGARVLRPQAKRWGQLTCREAVGCTDAANAWPPYVEQYGMTVVYRAEVSIAQPDFTAECLGARNANAEILAVAVDPNSMRRVGLSCARQGYHPTFLLPSAVVASSQDGDTNLEGALGVIPSSPWMSTSSPANAAMHDAVRRYTPSLKLNMASTLGWAAGKMFEAAVAKAGGLGSPPSRDRLIGGLHQFSGETLGGVSPPLTLRPGPQRDIQCYFAVEFKDGKWIAANGGRHLCP